MPALLQQFGHDVVHTLDLPNGNQTTDEEINNRSIQEGRVVITKDADFIDSFLLRGRPSKLLSVSTGNIKNSELESIFETNMEAIVHALQNHDYVELTRTAIVVRA